MIEPIQQDPADLVLTVLPGKIDAPLTVLKQAALEMDGWRLTFHIIGESHLVTVERDGQPVLCELLACVEVTAEAYLHHQRFDDLAAGCFEMPGYSTAVDFDVCAEDRPFNQADGVLEVTFPEIEGQQPVTRIMWARVGKNMVRWQTVHVYPYRGGVICVRSLSYFNSLHYNREL